MRKVIRYNLYQKEDLILIDDAWQFNSSGKFKWLQRLAVKILSRYGKNYLEKNRHFHRIEVNEDDLFKGLNDARINLFENGRNPAHLFIGPETFSKLLKTANTYDFMSFSFFVPINTVNRGEREILGLKIHIIPHMEGYLVTEEIN